MNRKYLIYGVGALIISLLVYVYAGSLMTNNVYSKKVAYRIDEEATKNNTEEESSDKELQEEEENSSVEEKKAENDNVVEPEESKEEIDDDNESVENEIIEEDINEPIEENAMEDDGYEIVEVFESKVSSDFFTNIKYEKYPMNLNYVVVLDKSAKIREEPTLEAKVLKEANRNEKINLSKAVKGQYLENYDSDVWYKVYWEEGGQTTYGYMLDSLGQARSFRVKEVERFLEALKVEVDNNSTAYISNYKNTNGAAPFYNGKSVDSYGERRYQAAPGYSDPNYESEFRYFPDGALLSVLEEKDNFLKVTTLNFSGEYWIPKKYVSFENSIEELSKIVVIDRKNQNEIVFEYSEDKWNLVSYALATTGKKGRYSRETPLGYYMVIQKRPSFVYYGDGSNKIAGFASYTTRFTGGIYIHGYTNKL